MMLPFRVSVPYPEVQGSKKGSLFESPIKYGALIKRTLSGTLL